MKLLLILLLPFSVSAAQIPPTPFPVFLKQGFSSILEFEEIPMRVVLGDSQSFQVEKLERSLVVKTLVGYASSNMFVYFKTEPPRLFVLTASEDAQPTYYKKFEAQVQPKSDVSMLPYYAIRKYRRSTHLTSLKFDAKKDYLTIDTEISADSTGVILPNWKQVRLTHNGRALVPYKLWSERKDIQRDSAIKARFIFAKPNLQRNLEGATLVIPLVGDSRTISVQLKGGIR